MNFHPSFLPVCHSFAALRAAVSSSWNGPGKQRRHAKCLILVAMTPRQRHHGHRGRAAAPPSVHELTFPTKTFKSRVAAFNGRLWSSWACERCRSRADARSERLAALYTYCRRL